MPKFWKTIVFAASALILRDACGQTDNGKQFADLLPNTAIMQATWNDVHKPKGSHLEAFLVKTEKAPDGSMRQLYEFRVTGVPASATYMLEQWPISTLRFYSLFKKLGVSSDGLLICNDESKPCGNSFNFHEPVAIWTTATQGEPLRFLLTSEDEKVKLTGITVPFPAEGSDQGCHIQLLRLFHKGEMLFLYGEGFPARSDVTLLIDVAGKLNKAHAKVTEDGLILRAESPISSVNPPSGEFKESVIAGAPCKPTAKIMYGAGSDKAK